MKIGGDDNTFIGESADAVKGQLIGKIPKCGGAGRAVFSSQKKKGAA